MSRVWHSAGRDPVTPHRAALLNSRECAEGLIHESWGRGRDQETHKGRWTGHLEMGANAWSLSMMLRRHPRR